MEANVSSANGGSNGEGIRVEDCTANDQASTKTLEECTARAKASKKSRATEKKRKHAEKMQRLRKKNPKKKGGQARKSAIKQRKNGRQLPTTGSVGGESPTHGNTTDQNVRETDGDAINNSVQGNTYERDGTSSTTNTTTTNETNTGNPTPPVQGPARNPQSKTKRAPKSEKEKFDLDDEANVDLLMAPTPTNEAIMRCFIREINHRAKVWHEREMLKAAEKLLSKGIKVMHDFFGGNVAIKDDDLMNLYISRCKLRVRIRNKKPSINKKPLIMEDTEQALRHGCDQGPALKNLFDQLGYYERPANESLDITFARVKEQMLSKFAREAESRTQAEVVAVATDTMEMVGRSNVGTDDNGISMTIGSDDNDNSNNDTSEVGEEVGFWSDGSGDCVLPKDKECTWSHLQGYCEDMWCDNCSRQQIVSNWKDSYYFDFHQVCATNIKAVHSPLRVATAAYKLEKSKLLNLCTECHKFLSPSTKTTDREKWNNVWPSFYWNLLTGKDMVSKKPFHLTYGANELWKFIPSSMRGLWLCSIKEVAVKGIKVYNDVDAHHPKSHYVDRTQDTRDFKKHIEAYTFEGMLRVMAPNKLNGHEDEESMILPDVLCPWGCSEFAFQCKELDPSIMIQNHLRHAQLNLPRGFHKNMHYVETSRLDYLRDREEGAPDTVLLNPKWPVLPSIFLFPGKGPMVATCRNCDTNSKRKRYVCHAARKLNANILSSRTPDQCCQVRLQSRIVKPVLRKGMNTVPSLGMFTVSYAGADCATVSTDSRFFNNGVKPVTFEHECLSMSRLDIQQHARSLVDDGQIPSSTFSDWMAVHSEMSQHNKLEGLSNYATFVPPKNAITLQKASAEDHKIIVELKTKEVKNRNQTTNVKVLLSRSWCASIYNMQVEDPTLYGWAMKAVNLRPRKWMNSTMLTWSLLGMISSSKELYSIVDQCEGGHSYKTPSGHLLTYIHHKHMKHCDSAHVKKSPFIPSMTQGQLCKVINEYLPRGLKDGNDSINKYYCFGYEYLKCIFNVKTFPKVKVVKGTGSLNNDRLEVKDVVISVTKTKPTGSAQFSFGDKTITRNTFEARVILSMTVDMDNYNEHDPDGEKMKWKFTGTRHCRHGGGTGGFRNWWQQERSSKAKNIMTKVITRTDDMDTYPDLPSHATYYVVVYVRLEELEVENYKLDLHRSVGGQCSVFCNCNGSENPLIISGMMDQERRNCISQSCKKRENYMCPIKNCKTRLCFKCLETRSVSQKRHVISPSTVPLAASEPIGATTTPRQDGGTNDPAQ